MKGFRSMSLTAGARPEDEEVGSTNRARAQRRRHFLAPTKYGVPSVGVASEVEDVGVVGRNDGQCVVDAGQETCPLDSSVHFHRFVQGLLGLAFVVSMINAAAWNTQALAAQHHRIFGRISQGWNGFFSFC